MAEENRQGTVHPLVEGQGNQAMQKVAYVGDGQKQLSQTSGAVAQMAFGPPVGQATPTVSQQVLGPAAGQQGQATPSVSQQVLGPVPKSN